MLWEIKQIQSKPESISELIRRLLSTKGLSFDDLSLSQFLKPAIPDIETLIKKANIDGKQFKKAIQLIKKYIQNKKPIVIYGDYDVDGICASAIIWETINSLEGRVLPFIPDRIDHGYGLSEKGLKKAISLFPDEKPLIITVDNGITGSKIIKKYQNLGYQVIVTDHHLPPKEKLTPDALVYTTNVSGTGISYIVSFALIQKKPPSDLLALATVCDQLPLTGLNRQFVIEGLKEIRLTKRLGLKTLMELSGINQAEEINTYHLGFILGPKINAAGRLGHALDALRLLCTKNLSQADKIARELNSLNQSRQQLTQESVQKAISLVDSLDSIPKIIIISQPSYHEGIIGLIAAKLVETFNRPTVVISQGEKISKASARSLPGIDITKILRQMSHHFIDLGGHEAAAGFTIQTSLIDKLKRDIQSVKISKSQLQKKVSIDLLLHPEQNLNDVYQALKQLSPFGPNFSEPVLSLSSLKLISYRRVGATASHLQLSLQSITGQTYSAIGFGQADNYSLTAKKNIDIAFRLQENSYQGNIKLQFVIEQLK